ncbi:hypothetical protein, partial [uncultured Microbacterium sp.]|uniref:hypothetical protein n=2 Tax=Microbacterium TaxID=33882 RepID=UPI0025E25EB7
RGVTLPAVRHDLTSLPARTLGRQDDSHNDWTYKTGSVHPLPAGPELTVRIQPVGETIPLAQARVTPDPDGSFAVSITVPPTIRPGQAVASISNYWDIATCPEGASCASAAVEFTVAP